MGAPRRPHQRTSRLIGNAAESDREEGINIEMRRAIADRLGVPAWALARAGAIIDVAIALALFAAAMIALATAQTGVGMGSREPDTLAYVLGAVLTLPLALRSRQPVAVLGVILVAVVVYDSRQYAGVNVDFFGPILSYYTVAARGPRRTSIIATVLVVAAVLVGGRSENTTTGSYIAVGVIIGGVWLLGDGVRSRRAYTERLTAQAEALRIARLELADQAVAQERVRIARELHDVVAHHMSAIVVQAALAQDRLEPDPAAAKRALGQIEDVSRSALREMRQILGVLRQADDDRGALAPAPSLGNLNELYAHARDGGLTVDASLEGGRTPLPPAVELTAYRIVQEAITNAMRHAAGTHVAVHLEQTPHALNIEVVDDGTAAGKPAAKRADGAGHGLIGMRERVSLLQGTFDAGPRPGGGFRVAATLPLEGSA